MERQEILEKIKRIIESNMYDVDTIIEAVPQEFLEDTKQMILERAQRESEEISRSLQDKTR